MTRPRRAALAALLASATLAAGCQALGSLAYYFRPRQIQKPEFEFPAGSRVAFVIEAADPRYESPVFNEALYERTVQTLRDGGSKAEFLPLRAAADLRRDHPDFDQWSLQRIGRELNASHVLYVRIDRLTIRQSPDYPVLTPAVELHMKVIGCGKDPEQARLWPAAREGYAVSRTRPAAEAADSEPDAADIQARKLGIETAYWVALPFIAVDREVKPPVEP